MPRQLLSYFQLADELVAHLSPLAAAEKDQRVQGIYAGFVAVSAVTVYEIAVRELLVAFGDRKSSEFGAYLRANLSRINGQIKTADLKDRYLEKFGERFPRRFRRLIAVAERRGLRMGVGSISASYGNIIQWRHDFAHGGSPPRTATFEEVCAAYQNGKVVLDCFRRSLRR